MDNQRHRHQQLLASLLNQHSLSFHFMGCKFFFLQEDGVAEAYSIQLRKGWESALFQSKIIKQDDY